MRKKNIILAAAGGDYARALSVCEETGLSPGHLCYGITPSGQLARERVPSFARGGVMILSDAHGGGRGAFDPDRLAGEIIAEASYRGYLGVFADFEGHVTPSLAALVSVLDGELSRRDLALFCSARYADACRRGIVLVSSQVTGGSYGLYLDELADRYGPNRLALELIPIRMDFLLPSSSASGTPLSAASFAALTERQAPLPFFSPELAARYFTYTDDAQRTHFVLYDDARTLASKLLTAHSRGISYAFGLYADLAPTLPALLAALDESETHKIGEILQH